MPKIRYKYVIISRDDKNTTVYGVFSSLRKARQALERIKKNWENHTGGPPGPFTLEVDEGKNKLGFKILNEREEKYGWEYSIVKYPEDVPPEFISFC